MMCQQVPSVTALIGTPWQLRLFCLLSHTHGLSPSYPARMVSSVPVTLAHAFSPTSLVDTISKFG